MGTVAEAVDRLGGVDDARAWGTVKITFLVAALVFLVTIGLGFLNTIAAGELPRWQLLVHLHSGTLGWITLSVFGIAAWLFAGDREVGRGYADRVRWLTWLAIVTFLVLIASFGIATARGGQWSYLLAGAAVAANLVIWAVAVVFVLELRRMAGATTAQWLMAGGLVIAGVATSMGALTALGIAGIGLPPELAILGHVLAIEGYLFLAGTATIEWVVRGGDTGDRSGSGLLQLLIGLFVGLLGPVLVGLAVAGVPQETLGMVANLGTLAGIVLFGLVFLARIGPAALRFNPLDGGPRAWMMLATLWVVGLIVMWPLRVALGGPEWWIPVYAHMVFVGTMTNAILGVMSAWTADTRRLTPWAEPAGMWLTNIGLAAFFAGEIAADVRHGAWILGIGVLLAVLVMIHALTGDVAASAAPAAEAGDD